MVPCLPCMGVIIFAGCNLAILNEALGVQESGNLTVWQKKQLTGAYQQLLEKMRALMERRDGAGLVTGGAGMLLSMEQVGFLDSCGILEEFH